MIKWSVRFQSRQSSPQVFVSQLLESCWKITELKIMINNKTIFSSNRRSCFLKTPFWRVFERIMFKVITLDRNVTLRRSCDEHTRADFTKRRLGRPGLHEKTGWNFRNFFQRNNLGLNAQPSNHLLYTPWPPYKIEYQITRCNDLMEVMKLKVE